MLVSKSNDGFRLAINRGTILSKSNSIQDKGEELKMRTVIFKQHSMEIIWVTDIQNHFESLVSSTLSNCSTKIGEFLMMRHNVSDFSNKLMG